jgi:hypothetical protein
MVVKKAAKKPAKKAVRKRRGTSVDPQILRTAVYLWLYATISVVKKATGAGSPTPKNINDNVTRVIGNLKKQGAQVNPDPQVLASIFEVLLDSRYNSAFSTVASFLTEIPGLKGPWQGSEGHPTPPELDSIFISPTRVPARGRK